MADITAVALYLHYWSLFRPVPQWALALVALAIVFVLNMLSVRMLGGEGFWFPLGRVAAFVAFLLTPVGAIVVASPSPPTTAGFHNITDGGGFFPLGIAPVFALTLGVIFAFGGTEMVGVAAGEAAEASRVLPKAINSMILRIFVFYVGSVILMALVLPYTAYSSNESPFVTFFSGIGIPHAGDIIQVVVLTAALSSLNAGLYSTGRTLRSMAVAGEAPGFAARLNRHHVPYGGIIITSTLGLFGVALNAFLAEDAFEIVMNLAGIGIAGTWAMILVTHLSFLRRVRAGKEQRPVYRMPGAPFTNYLSLAFFIVVVASNLTSASGRWTLALFAVVVVAMIGGWFAVRGSIRADLLESMIADGDEEG